MVAQILLFGATAAIAGSRSIEIEIGTETTANLILEKVSERFPGMSSLKLNLSINQQYATGDEIICDNDELAIFTAVSGG